VTDQGWRTLPSPAAAGLPVDDATRAAQLAAELDAAFQARARLYWAFYLEARAAYGAEAAAGLLARAIRRRGAEAGAALFAGIETASPADVAAHFLRLASPDWGRLFPHTVEAAADGTVRLTVHRCPLKDAWVADGRTPDEVAMLCRIAGEADHGVFGAAPVRFGATTWQPGREGCCVLTLAPVRSA
jgi:hypothetical protein